MNKLTTKEILHYITGAKKGVWVKLVKEKQLDCDITKISTMWVRLGVEYTHIKAVGKETAEPLPWGTWLKGLEGLVIEYKGNYYLRVADANLKHNKSVYYRNEKEISKKEVIALIGGKKLESKKSAIYNIKFENIVSIG